MGEMIRMKKAVKKERLEKKSIQKSKAEDYNLVLRHFQGLMLNQYHHEFHSKK